MTDAGTPSALSQTACESGAAVLEVRGLAKRYASGGGVSDVTLTVPAGSITAFIGVNGAGKSTTLRCILGLIPPDAGTIGLFGRPAGPETRRRKVGFLPEERGLFPRERAREAIAFHARLKGFDKRHALYAADRLLERRIGLGGRTHARASKKSCPRGNAQRVQILCALAHAPELLILDEPLSGLDPVGTGEILSLFAEFRASGWCDPVLHPLDGGGGGLCDRVAMLAGGRTVFHGPVEDAALPGSPHGVVGGHRR